MLLFEGIEKMPSIVFTGVLDTKKIHNQNMTDKNMTDECVFKIRQLPILFAGDH
jgi:hypothetical protein